MTESRPSEGYSKTVLDHFERPRNSGVLEDANGVGYMTNPVCGDTLLLMLRIENGRITEARWQSNGCAASIAASSRMSELALEQPIARAEGITRETIVEALDGLPASKLHASVLAADALQHALADYRAKQKSEEGS